MVAAAAVGGFAATPGADSRAFLQELWRMPEPSGEQRYFDGMLYLMSMMHSAGEFDIIGPKARGQGGGTAISSSASSTSSNTSELSPPDTKSTTPAISPSSNSPQPVSGCA
jgi:hypothetical protein